MVIRAVSNNLNAMGNDLGTSDNALDICATRLADFMMLILANVSVLQSNLAPPMKEKSATSINTLITKYNLIPHPEGGFYKRVHQSEMLVNHVDRTELASLPDLGQKRLAVTSVYYLLTADSFSAWHKLQSEEIWHFYEGYPLTIFTINDETGGIASIQLGDPLKHDDCIRQYAVKAGTWFCAITNGSYSFVGATVAPDFDFADFELGDRQKLLAAYPHLRSYIEKYTRVCN